MSTFRGSGTPGVAGTIAVAAEDVTNTPAGDIAATDVQSALNELDTEKAAVGTSVSGFTLGGAVRLSTESAGFSYYDIDANLTENTWESIGPTGSGADNIWTDLDQVPTTAKGLIVQVATSSAHSSATRAVHKLQARPTGGTGTFTTNTYVIHHTTNEDVTSSRESVGQGILPLDSNNSFDVLWSITTTNRSAVVVWLLLLGWIE